ncbi:MAG: dihydroorotase [Bacteroidia bacterium]
MNVLIKHARIIDPKSSFHNKTADILIEGGTIVQIKKGITASGVKTIEGDDLMVSVGWLDMQSNLCDPGFEHKEDLESGLKAAAAGGFTGICVVSGTNPPLHNKAQIEYLINRAKNSLTDVYPVGALSQKQEGHDLAELYDMKLAGAVAFSDYKKPVKDAGLVLRALQYSTNIDTLVMTHCDDKSISHEGQMNEGEMSTSLGLKGIPALAEELMLQRNIAVLEYTGGRLHIPAISTKGSAELIKKAKSNGLRITCGVAAHNLLLDDSALADFDTNYKVNPPLRSKKDVDALRKAVENGVIDVIVSDHCPQDVECKELEFDLADHGIIALQTAFPTALTALKGDYVETLVECFTTAPRSILGIEQPTIGEGAKANLTIFKTTEYSTLTEKEILSRSKNSPFIGKPLQGKVIGVVNNNKGYWN